VVTTIVHDVFVVSLCLYRLYDSVVRRGPPVLQIDGQRSDSVRHLHSSETRADGPRLLRLRRRTLQHRRFNSGKCLGVSGVEVNIITIIIT